MGQASRDTKLPPPPREDAPLAEWARWCAEVGRLTGAFKVFPCVPGEKRPLRKGWQAEAACDPKTVAAMWRNDPEANIGLAIQPGFVAIDGDLYKPGAEAALDAFEAEHGRLPDTLKSRTARGGYHLIYATAKVLGNGKGSLPNFGDVRGHGGFIVGPGSSFEGKRYAVEHLSWPVPLPSDIEAMLSERKTRDRSKPDLPARFVLVDDPRNVQAFADWCAGKPVCTIATPFGEVAEPCIEHQGGNNMLAATGSMAHDYGLSEDKAAEIAFEHFNPRCEPPWDEEEFEKHFRSGYRSASGGSLGWRAPARDYRSLFKRVPAGKAMELPSGREETEGRFRVVDREGMSHIKPPRWLIRDFLPVEAYAMLVGAPSTYKSFVALDIALTVATGKPENPIWLVEESGPVLYVAGEGRSAIINRVAAWEKVHWASFKAHGFMLGDPVPNVNEDWEPFIKLARERSPEGYKLIVIDTVGRAMQGANENSQEHASKLTARIEQLIKSFGCTVLAVHHTGYSNQDRGKGSMEFLGAPDTIATLDRGDGLSAIMRLTKQKDSAEWEKARRIELSEVELSPGTKSLVPIGISEARTVQSQRAKVARNFEAQFLIAYPNAPRQKDGTVLWSNVRASMIGMNDDQAQNAPAFRRVLDRWFSEKNPLRAKYDTGLPGPNNAIVLKDPREPSAGTGFRVGSRAGTQEIQGFTSNRFPRE